ncbi:hypothetical protein RRG08_050270 [Elysia crispata]|uniref:Uncharacterized protein n=1 Tax=Elysia crispata TaxID=231223 RepID=A0AAE1B4Q0_9GAST|nr:hypothetical protein RRG08_050270 [Elysia crispata]
MKRYVRVREDDWDSVSERENVEELSLRLLSSAAVSCSLLELLVLVETRHMADVSPAGQDHRFCPPSLTQPRQ